MDPCEAPSPRERRMMIRFGRERRRSRRSGLALPVQFRIYAASSPETASPFLPGQLHDFSRDGVALDTNVIQSERLHVFHPSPITSEQCLLEIRVPHSGEDLSVHGKVVWYDQNGEENPFLFRMGIQILDATRDLRRQIESSISQFESAAAP